MRALLLACICVACASAIQQPRAPAREPTESSQHRTAAQDRAEAERFWREHPEATPIEHWCEGPPFDDDEPCLSAHKRDAEAMRQAMACDGSDSDACRRRQCQPDPDGIEDVPEHCPAGNH